MKTLRSTLFPAALLVAALLQPVPVAGGAASIASDALVVRVEEGVHRVRVEIQDAGTDHWTVLAIAYVDGQGGTAKFRIPDGTPLERLRVSTHEAPPPHAGLQFAPHTFEPHASDGSSMVFSADMGRGASLALDAGAEAATGVQEVEESDIWRLDGDRLYFFNQYRGLQVFDLSNPEQPVQSGYLRFEAAGEQLYLLDPAHIVLLAEGAWNADGEVVVVRVDGESPSIVSRTPVTGRLHESRMIGEHLYLLTHRHDLVEGDPYDYYEAQFHLTALDLSDRSDPVVVSGYAGKGYVTAVHATSRHFLVAYRAVNTESWSSGPNRVAVFQLDDGFGRVSLRTIANVGVPGAVPDKFKLNIEGDILTVISHEWRWEISGGRQRTHLETFRLTALEGMGSSRRPQTASLEDGEPGGDDWAPPPPPGMNPNPPDPPPWPGPLPAPDIASEQLAGIVLGEGEQLFASRFDGDRAYVVTFFIVDPLYVVDLSDPANPRIAGELEIPGFSTYLEPMGDRMLAVGVEDQRVTAMLFDVGDPANPTELERVYLGPEQGHTWSEANYDERAVQILHDQGLMLAPFESFDWQEGNRLSRMQLISFSREGLTKGGTIEHTGQARRATALSESLVVSISQQDLHIVDASDRDQPAILASRTLSWSTDEVFVFGDHLVHLAHAGFGYWWGGGRDVQLVVTTQDDPSEPLAILSLGRDAVLNTLQAGEVLHLARSDSPRFGMWRGGFLEIDRPRLLPGEETDDSGVEGMGTRVSLQTIDLTDPLNPRVSFVHEEDFRERHVDWASGWLLDGGAMVWVFSAMDWYSYHGSDDDGIEGDRNNALLWTFVHAGGALPEVRFSGGIKGATGSYQNGHLAGGALYLSRVEWSWDPERHPRYMVDYRMRPIRLSDLSNPVAGTEQRLPGFLENVRAIPDDPGALLFTSGYQSHVQEGRQMSRFSLQVSVFDGTHVYLVDEMTRTSGIGARVYDGEGIAITAWNPDYWSRPAPVESEPRLEIWRYRLDGGFHSEATIPTEGPIWSLRADRGRFFGVQNRLLTLVERSDTPEGGWEKARYSVPTKHWIQMDGAAVLDDRVYLPLGYYGVLGVDLNDPDDSGYRSMPDAEHDGGVLGGDLWDAVPNYAARITSAAYPGKVGALDRRAWLYRSQYYAPLDPAAEDLGDGWRHSEWFGRFQDLAHPWHVHDEHGWFFSYGSEGVSTYLWDNHLGWAWTGPHVFPYLYVFEQATWVYYLRESGLSGTRWFYRFGETDQGWFHHTARDGDL